MHARLISAGAMVLVGLLCDGAVAGQEAPPQTQADDFTRYELQEPGSGAFRILYDVTATRAGAAYYFNSIRAGADEVVHGVTDLATGRSSPAPSPKGARSGSGSTRPTSTRRATSRTVGRSSLPVPWASSGTRWSSRPDMRSRRSITHLR